MARVQPGERVVVLGAGGGVGLAAVQLAVALGADHRARDFGRAPCVPRDTMPPPSTS
jgi:D-arabinose 1-dehydrogenase-like Zn-dependent alcohol dehydrogenase